MRMWIIGAALLLTTQTSCFRILVCSPGLDMGQPGVCDQGDMGRPEIKHTLLKQDVARHCPGYL